MHCSLRQIGLTMAASPFSAVHTFWLTSAAMLAFAANSVLCRLALTHTSIDAASFSAIRLFSAAFMLVLLLLWRERVQLAEQPKWTQHVWRLLANHGSWAGATALLVYVLGFSYAYVSIETAVGALLLFGAVQLTMLGYGLLQGERWSGRQQLGFACATLGVVALLWPVSNAAAHAVTDTLSMRLGVLWMIVAGIAWGVYSLLGRQLLDPVATTASHFVRCLPVAIGLLFINTAWQSLDLLGVGYAVASGALASGVGYAIWYRALNGLSALLAASVQLSVPMLAAVAAVIWLDESMTIRLVLAGTAILLGLALVILQPTTPSKNSNQ